MSKVDSVSEIGQVKREHFSNALKALEDTLLNCGLFNHASLEVLEQNAVALANAYVVLLQKHVKERNALFSRHVRVDRTISPNRVLASTHRCLDIDLDVIAHMPRGQGDDVEVWFFKPDLSERDGMMITPDDLEMEFTSRGLIPADPYTLAELNRADPLFADEKPHGTQWKDVCGNWCYALFGEWDGKRNVVVQRTVNKWDDIWWFAGLRQ